MNIPDDRVSVSLEASVHLDIHHRSRVHLITHYNVYVNSLPGIQDRRMHPEPVHVLCNDINMLEASPGPRDRAEHGFCC